MVNEAEYFRILYGSIRKFIVFVHEPPYQTTVMCCNPVFRFGSSRMDHHTSFHVRVGLAPIIVCMLVYDMRWLDGNVLPIVASGYISRWAGYTIHATAYFHPVYNIILPCVYYYHPIQ